MMDLEFIKLLAPLLVGSFLIMPSYATDFQMPFSWIKNDDGSAAVSYSSDYDDEAKYFNADISHSKSGSQRLYFDDSYIKDLNVCTYKFSTSESITMIFNGQAVKMLRWCKKFADIDKYYFLYTPETERGHNYVVNLFKVATAPIEIKYDGETLYFPVLGFTKEWNSAGGDAI